MESNLIVEKEKSYIDEITDNINKVKTADFGYNDKRDYLIQKINEFMQAVEQNQPKVHTFVDENDYNLKKSPYIHHSGKKEGQYKSARHRDEFEGKYHWNQRDGLDDYLKAVLEECDLKLADVKVKLKNYSSLIETPVQQQVISPFADEMTNMNPDEVRKFDKTMYEFLEWHILKQKEIIISFLNGTFEFKEEDLIRSNMKTEIAKIVLESADRKEKIIVEANKFVNKNKI